MLKLFIVALLVSNSFSQVFAQALPRFLPGTWKMENSEKYEHWDILNDNCYKGFSYDMKTGKMVVNEYLEINKLGNNVIYTATVLHQNQGIGIDFKLNPSDTLFSFENAGHDFPKFIRYKQISENKMKAIIGTKENSFTLYFDKIK